MEKRIFTLILVVVLGVIVGVGIVFKQDRNPAMEAMIEKQNQIIQGQQRLESQFVGQVVKKSSGIVSNLVVGDNAKVQNLEQRLAKIEGFLKEFDDVFKQIRESKKRQEEQQARQREEFSKVYTIPVEHSKFQGKKNAPVTIVEFSDFQCPYCARFHKPLMEAIKAYPKKIKYVLKNFPLSFHKEAKPAAKASFAAGEQGKYWEMVELLLDNGKVLSDAKILELAKSLNLNMKKFSKSLKDDDAKWEEYVRKDMELGGKIGVRGTPSFFINGRRTNAGEVAAWKSAIDKALKEQKKK